MSIDVRTFPTPDAVADAAADIIADLVASVPDCVIGLPTGSTPIATYERLIERHRQGLSFAEVTTFNLDEYVGLSPDDPQSYHAYMARHLFDHIDIDRSRIHIPDGAADDLDAAADAFEEAIDDVDGVDLWMLGIGSNGHIAFNEPGCDPDSLTRVVDLSEDTILANSRFFDSADEVPRTAITAGVATILDAERIILLAYGSTKAAAIAEAVAGPVTADCPASYLQTHPDCTFLIDEAAASLLDP